MARLVGLLLAWACMSFSSGAGSASAADLRFTAGEYSGFTRPFLERVARDYEALHPDIHIQIEVIPWDSYLQKLTTDISSGDQPDIAIVPTMWVSDLAADGLLEPLDPLATPEFKSKFIPAFLVPASVNGQLLGLPAAASARAMVVNTDLLQKAGVKAPKTWDDLLTAAKAISALPNAYGFGLPGKEVEVDTYFYYALWGFGGEILKNGKSGLSSPEAIRAATFYMSLINDKATEPSPTAHSREDVFKLFKEGRIGIVFTYPMLVPQLKAEAPNLRYAVLPLPVETQPITLGVTDVLTLSSSSKNQKAAWDFMQFLYDAKYRAEFDRAEGLLPVTAEGAADSYYRDNPDIAAFAAGLAYARFAPTIKGWSELSEITLRSLQTMYLGQKTPTEAMTDAARQIDDVLARR
ncbi:multiple sugar transport system substrate-binding protein [Ancylobacter sp. 3268]|uniref:ABC transporter substrate-binding protein n=1 Tax=Ancylobacter sp. 3268 TaxID=2817752 RepID=UPI002856752E|nr:sugar ABC transporter substrate-binding protein [Ancylobacter sp. 3268]MDR6955104.1 multiple sugar transport system substrate-binding protein [Ancylobacter sp. 3268]